MTCQHYNRNYNRRPATRRGILTATIVACVLCATLPTRGQEICDPAWGGSAWGGPPMGGPVWSQPGMSVMTMHAPSPGRLYYGHNGYYGTPGPAGYALVSPYGFSGPQSAQAGPWLPPLYGEDGTPTITSYPPVDGSLTLPAGERSGAGLEQVPGEFRLILREAFLNRLLARSDSDAGPVTDFILGANVTGSQQTQTCLTVDVQPSEQTARLLLQLTGTTENQTIGVTPQAAVRSRGTHQFLLTKQIDFDGLKLSTRSPAAWVTPQLTNEAAQTLLTGVPLLGDVANQFALSEAERQRPAAELIVTQRVTDQAAPRFNSEVDQQLASANDRLRDLAPRSLAQLGLTNARLALKSTEDALLYGIVLPPDIPSTGATASQVEGFAVGPLPFPVPSGESFTLAIHEELANRVLGRLPFGGQQVSDRTIDRMLSLLGNMLTDLSLPLIDLDDLVRDDPEFATLVLAGDEPLRFHFEADRIVLTALAGFRPLLTPEIPTQQIDIPFRLETIDGRRVLIPEEVRVSALPEAAPNPLVELARPIIRQQVTGRLRSFPLVESFPLALPGLTPTTLTLHDMTLVEDWLIITVD